MMVTSSDVTTYFINDSVMSSLWGALSPTEMDSKITLSERIISQLKYVGKRSVVTQSDIFPRDYTDVLDYITTFYVDRENYDDILQAWTNVDGILPNRVKVGIYKQIKHIMLSEDFLMEKKVLDNFKGNVTTGNANLEMKFDEYVNEESMKELSPFLAKINRVYYDDFSDST